MNQSPLVSPLDFRQPSLRYLVKLGLDVGLALVAWSIATALGALHPLWWAALVWAGWVMAFGVMFSLPRQHYRLVGFWDSIRVVVVVGVAILVAWTQFRLMGITTLPLRGWVNISFLTVFSMLGIRAAVRAFAETRHRAAGVPQKRTLVVGAGRAGVLVVEEMERHLDLGSKVIGFVDDAFEKQGLRVHGIPVLGTSDLMSRIISEWHVEKVVIAIPSASGRQMRQLNAQLSGLDVEVKTVPGIFNLLEDHSWKPELRDISIEDLLRREPAVLDQESLRAVLEDQVVLITGAGGSIGSELAKQICKFRPSRLVLLGRGENSLWLIERELRRIFPNQPLALEVCDIRNPRRLKHVFEYRRPSVVFHAAAHKHVPILENHPEEAVENNILGTRNVLEVSLAHDVKHFVNISTDKAVNPTNVLGVSKRVAELLVAEASAKTPPGSSYVSVRFGNVLGSRGSVLPIFQDQIRRGGPVTVTHPEMTRYFMTIPEASQLVIQAGILGDTGKVYVLDMGDPVKIVDMATDLIRLSGLIPGEDVEVQFSGMRPGEKLYEECFYGDSAVPSSVHPKVFEACLDGGGRFDVGQHIANLSAILDLPREVRLPSLLVSFKDMVPSYKASVNGMGKWDQYIAVK